MASQYQHRQFFRRVPNELLAQYFVPRNADLSLDFKHLTETEVDPIFAAFTALPKEQQAKMEVDFQDINALAMDGGIEALRNGALSTRTRPSRKPSQPLTATTLKRCGPSYTG